MVRWTANKVWVEKQKQRKKRMGVKKECERRCAYPPPLLHYHRHLVVGDRLREIRERIVHLQHSLDVIQLRLTAIHHLIIQHQHQHADAAVAAAPHHQR